jgi:hypothetical protein
MKSPDFDDLVGSDLDPAERERLRRVHDLLVAAGPPPELPLRLEAPRVRAFPRRRALAFLLAAALVAAAFGAGWFARGEDGFQVRRAVPLRATPDAPGASGLIKLGFPDANGNWQMLVTVRGLRPLPKGGYYILLLTKEGKPVATCGTFNVTSTAETTVRLGASYRLKNFDGWVVQPWMFGHKKLNERIYLRTVSS